MRTKTAEYRIYYGIKTRCENPNANTFQRYGAKGIKNRFRNFEEFLEEVGPRPSKRHTIDRIDSAGNYEPGNVRWATWTEQANNKRTNIRVEFQGRLQTVAQWAEETGIPAQTISYRLKAGWKTGDALGLESRFDVCNISDAKTPPHPMSEKHHEISPAALCARQLAPVRAWAYSNRGSIQQLADEVARRSGQPCNRHMIGRWLREENPVQPSFGYGLHLLAAYEHLATAAA